MRKSRIWHEGLQAKLGGPYKQHPNGYWIFTHGAKVIKIESWTELPSPQKSPGIHISVIIANWNRPLKMVKSSIESVLNQDFPPENFEVILVDDASDISPKPICHEIVKKYPNHNFRAYLLERTRCWACMHTYNVGLRRAAGWILMTMQSEAVLNDDPERDLDDSYPKQPVLEGVWRHHNVRDQIGLIPRRLNQIPIDCHSEEHDVFIEGNNKYRYWPYFPHDHGLSVKKKYVHSVRGYPEHSIGDPAVDYITNLTKLGIKFTEDVNMQLIHRNYMIPKNVEGIAYQVRSTTEGPPSLKAWLSAKRPDWLAGHWGELTENEEKNVIRSKPN